MKGCALKTKEGGVFVVSSIETPKGKDAIIVDLEDFSAQNYFMREKTLEEFISNFFGSKPSEEKGSELQIIKLRV